MGYESVLSVTQPMSIAGGAKQELVEFWLVAEWFEYCRNQARKAIVRRHSYDCSTLQATAFTVESRCCPDLDLVWLAEVVASWGVLEGSLLKGFMLTAVFLSHFVLMI